MKRIATVLLLVLAACSKSTDPSSEPLTGTWIGQPSLLGMETLTLALTDETGGEFTGSGTFTSTIVGGPPGTVTLTGLRIADQLQVTMNIHSTTGDLTQAFTGVVEATNRFHILFPGGAGAVRVIFLRQ